MASKEVGAQRAHAFCVFANPDKMAADIQFEQEGSSNRLAGPFGVLEWHQRVQLVMKNDGGTMDIVWQ
jgi:hypothetical protein